MVVAQIQNSNDNFQSLLAEAHHGMALPARFYTDEALYQHINETLFIKSWQYAAHISQLKNKGDYICFQIAGQNLMLMRQDQDNIACFYNVCQHRGHLLLEGTGNTARMVCPYHAWSYKLDGNLFAAPNSRAVDGFDKTKICLTKIRHEIFCGFIFVNLDDNALTMDKTFPDVKQAIMAHHPAIEEMQFAHSHHSHEYCNWLLAVENYNECYHCGHVHVNFSSGVIDPETYRILPFGEGRCLQHSAGAAKGESAWYDTSQGDYASFFLFPAFSLQIYPSGMVNSYHWQPLSVDDTMVYRGWYSTTGTVDEGLEKIIYLDKTTTFAEDLILVKNVQKGLNSKGYRPGPLILDAEQKINSEHPVAILHQWLKETITP